MANFFASLSNAVVDRTPDELITAVIIALSLSLAMAGLYFLGRKKVGENLMPLTALMIVANLLSMAVGAGYMARPKRTPEVTWKGVQPGTLAASEAILVEIIFRSADENRDGLLSGEEASQAADKFVRKLDPNGQGSIDPQSLGHAIATTDVHGRGWFPRPPDPAGRRSQRRPRSLRSEPPADATPPVPTGRRTDPDTNERVSSTDPTHPPRD